MWRDTNEIAQIAARVSQDPDLARQMRADPEATLRELSIQWAEDMWARRLIVLALSVVVLVATAGGFGLSLMNRAVPQLLMALGSMALGALISLLASGALRRVSRD